MRHPQILPGRQGLPPTSNVPWSAGAEVSLRAEILLDAVMVSLWIIAAVVMGVVFRDHWAGLFLFPAMVLGGVWRYLSLNTRWKTLCAMVLNRPRSTVGLTEWTEHHWPGWSPQDAQFHCPCGRGVDMAKAEYYPSSTRYALICECGRGHFLVWVRHAGLAGKRIQ